MTITAKRTGAPDHRLGQRPERHGQHGLRQPARGHGHRPVRQPRPGATVTFTAPGTGASGTFASTCDRPRRPPTPAAWPPRRPSRPTPTPAAPTTSSASATGGHHASTSPRPTSPVRQTITVTSGSPARAPRWVPPSPTRWWPRSPTSSTTRSRASRSPSPPRPAGASGTFEHLGPDLDGRHRAATGQATSSTFTANTDRGRPTTSRRCHRAPAPANFAADQHRQDDR